MSTTEKSTLANESLELAYESVDSCYGYVDVINDKILNLIALYNANNLDEANNKFIEVIELLDLYIQLVSRIFEVIRLNNHGQMLQDQSIQKLEIHLLSILKAVYQAKESNDVVMLCDLLEYELVDNLTQWKITILPELKKSKGF